MFLSSRISKDRERYRINGGTMNSGIFLKENKANRVRRALLALTVGIVFLLQNTSGLFPRPWGIPAMLLPTLVICIGMFERELWGMFFGVLAGALIDAFSSQGFCYHSVMLLCAGYFSGLLITRLMRNNLKTCTLLSVVFLFVYNTALYLIYYFAPSQELAGYTYVNTYLPSVIYSSFFIPVFYFLVRSIEKKNKPE